MKDKDEIEIGFPIIREPAGDPCGEADPEVVCLHNIKLFVDGTLIAKRKWAIAFVEKDPKEE